MLGRPVLAALGLVVAGQQPVGRRAVRRLGHHLLEQPHRLLRVAGLQERLGQDDLVGGGVLLAVVGLLVIGAGRLGLPIGRLPGDINLQRGGLTVFIPLVSCLLASLVLTVVVNLVLWILRRTP